MKNRSFFILLLAAITISACGESEEERLAREQARLDSLRKVEQQKIDSMMAAMADTVSVTDDAAPVTEEEPTQSPSYALADEGAFVVQVGAWRSEEKAQSFVNKWSPRGYPSSYVVQYGNDSTGDVWFRVRIGYFKTQQDARNFGMELSQEINSGFWVANAK